MTHGSVAKKVRESKEKHPEQYCPKSGCLWRTNGGTCPRHTEAEKEPTAYEIRILDSLEEETL